LQNAAEFVLASECDGSVKFARQAEEADSGAIRLPDEIQVWWGVSEVQAAFVTSLAGNPNVVFARGRLGLALSSLLPLVRQRNRRPRYNFAGLGIEDLHNLSMIVIVWRIRLRPPIQLIQPYSHLKPGLFTSFAMFTVRTVDSQEGQQVAS
jgi:hypothetical protein